MTDKPPSKHQDTPQNTVQDYLDLILSPQNNNTPPNLQSVQQPNLQQQLNKLPERVEPSGLKSVSTPLSVVTGPTAARRQRHGDDTKPKPFADPVKPLALNIALPEVKSETVVKEATPEKKPVNKNVTPITNDAKSVVNITAPVIEPAPVIQSTSAPAAQATPSTEVKKLAESQRIMASQWLDNGRPSWAQTRFECLLFCVNGLTLAVPLTELGAIYPIDNELTPLFGQADWFLGLLSVRGTNIRTVNTAKVVMPERYTDAQENHFSYVITINGVDWGLAVDTVSNAITLEPDDVKWRGKRSKRPWLAGTVVGKMCGLLDVSQLAVMFIQQDKQQS